MSCLVALLVGCESNDQRVVSMAVEQAKRQAAQSQQTVELQQQVAEGTKQLVAADAKARQELVEIQQSVQEERREVGQLRDQLETDRKAIASHRYLDPILAAAITNTGILAACLLPLVLCWWLLRQRPEDTADPLVCEVLIDELTGDRPTLLSLPTNQLRAQSAIIDEPPAAAGAENRQPLA